MTPKLDEIEMRVLGVLIEKSLTQASTYPMTMNAIVLGANQKQNREPVVELAEADVARALTRLQQKNLVKQAPPSPGARSNRFGHACVEALQWDRRQQAIMAELFLRGRQTPGELRTHASRMTPFPDLEAVGNTLAELASHLPPFVEELAREPGRSANRWRHRLGIEGNEGAPTQTGAPARTTRAEFPPDLSVTAPPAPMAPSPVAASASNPTSGGDPRSEHDLAARVSRLETQVQELSLVVAEIRACVAGGARNASRGLVE